MERGDAPGLEATELLERSGQLGELSDRLGDVADTRHGWVVLVRGEAGIGKTALLHGFCRSLNRGVRVLWAACDPLFTPRPLGPLLDIARSVGGELRAELDRGARPHDVATALMNELEAPAPTVLILEDLHWADEATLDVVRLVSQRVRALPVLLVVTYRDEQVHRSHPLRIVLGELAGGERVRRVDLRGLSRASVAALARGATVDPDLLHDRTGGNPFFVTEALAADTDGVPGTVRDAVLARAARLSAPARATLDAVAIVPQRAEVRLLEALLSGTLDAVEECLSSGMLRAEEGGIAFRHELARLAIEESLAPDRAVALHRRALTALAQPGVGAHDLARLAHHAEAAADAPAVLHYARAAAEHAAAVGSPREAQDQYGRALRFAQGLPPEQRADLLERFGDAGYLTDMREEAVAALAEAVRIHRARGDLLRQAGALRLRSRLLTCMGRTAEAKAAAVDAIGLLEQLPPSRELARAYSALSHACMLANETEETVLWGDRAIALAERVGDTEALVNALNNVGTNELNRGLAAGRVKLERSLALARQAGLGPDVGRAYINLVGALARHHEWAQAERYLDPGIAYCREHGLEAWLKCLVAGKAGARLAQGDWDDAAELAASILNAPPDSVVAPATRRFWSLRSCGPDAATPRSGRCSTRRRPSPMTSATSSSSPRQRRRAPRQCGWKGDQTRSPQRRSGRSSTPWPCAAQSSPASWPSGAGVPATCLTRRRAWKSSTACSCAGTGRGRRTRGATRAARTTGRLPLSIRMTRARCGWRLTPSSSSGPAPRRRSRRADSASWASAACLAGPGRRHARTQPA